MRKIILTAIVLALVACADPAAKRETYDQINAEMNEAAKGAAKPASPDAVSAALLPPLEIETPKPQPPIEERFSLTFNNVPAGQFFMALAAGTRYNMLIHPEVTGTISANLKDVTLFEALDAIRELYGYDYAVEGNRIIIKPLTLQTRIFQVNYLMGSRKGTSDTRVSSGAINAAQPPTTSPNGIPTTPANTGANTVSIESSKVSTSSNSDFWADLKMALDAIVDSSKSGRSVVISPQSGVVVVRAMPAEPHDVAAYLKATQLSVDRQVILEAKILEVQLNNSYQSGINWAAFRTAANSRVSGGMLSPGTILQPNGIVATGVSSIDYTARTFTTAGSALAAAPGVDITKEGSGFGGLFGLAFQTSNFAALISFLESQGTVHVLSNPRIATLNNQKAVLKVGNDAFFVTNVSTSSSTTGLSGTTVPTSSVTLQSFFSGVVLDVTPQIDDAGNIILHVHPSVSKVSTVSQTIDLGTGGQLKLPLASSDTSETDSIVRGRNEQIIAIGGLMKQSSSSDRSQIPGAGDVPVVGGLFRNTNQVSQKSELVILIKPIVVDGENGWNQDILESQQRIRNLDPSQLK